MIKHMFDSAHTRVQTALGHLAAAKQELAARRNTTHHIPPPLQRASNTRAEMKLPLGETAGTSTPPCIRCSTANARSAPEVGTKNEYLLAAPYPSSAGTLVRST